MKIEFHPEFETDVAAVSDYYRSLSPKLGIEFIEELQSAIKFAAKSPTRFQLVKPHLRRANLKKFPYHFTFRELSDGIRLILLRHHRRNPSFGMRRD